MPQRALSTSTFVTGFGLGRRTNGWHTRGRMPSPPGLDAARAAWENEGGSVLSSDPGRPGLRETLEDRRRVIPHSANAPRRALWGSAITPHTMISNHVQFLDAIREKKLIRIKFYSHPDVDTVDRECAPLDYGPDLGAKDVLNRYWIWDYANTAGSNPLGLLPNQILNVRVLGADFDPEKLGVGARPWCVPRDWGTHPELHDQPVSVVAAKK